MLNVVDAHAEGESGKVVVGGVGPVPMSEPVTRLVLESPAGLIRIEAACANGKVERVKLVNQPAFIYHQDAKIDVPGLGKVAVDVAYGGMTFAFVDAESLGISLDVSQEAVLYDLGQRIKKAAAEQLAVSHPADPRIPGITNTSFTGPLMREEGPDGEQLVRSANAVIVSPGRLDRSPCGTGTSARLALLRGSSQHLRARLDHMVQPARPQPLRPVPEGLRGGQALGTGILTRASGCQPAKTGSWAPTLGAMRASASLRLISHACGVAQVS